ALGAATPPGVAQSIEQARDAKAKAEADLAALRPPRPPVDPAEIARLEEEIARQQQIITQLEPVQVALGAATPPGVAQSIEQARTAKANAEAELAALTSGAPVQPGAPTEAQAPVEAAPVEAAPPVNVPPVEAAPPVNVPPPVEAIAPPPEPAPPVVAPPPAPAPAPRLVMDEGKDLPLPTAKPEIIVGREDPISGIFPEIDLTPYGGETGGVSRQHARLNHTNGDWSVTDLNSTNYTRVDGAKIEPNVAVPLKDGMRLQFGRVAMTFRI
ncbi:MAG TPA: FHA domain-containing protein, partial [Roseiflexaceae bacterium]|nr:FHA domain-containing protein [Roseiflexaceae bacterium]